jgi:beta-glucosidase/6-phospho-beta-glucosidase/beta-galactosidase
MSKDIKKIFPKKFMWGASTSAHQVEGGNHNQWTVWEQEHAAEMAKHAHKHLKKLAIWDKIKSQPLRRRLRPD